MITKPESIVQLEKIIKKPLERLQHPHSWAKAQSYALDDNGHIITLNLRGTGIQNITITGDFKHLQKLDLSKNTLVNVEFKTDLPNLELLDISYNKVDWEKLTIPNGFSHLKYLYAYQSKLKNIVFDSPLPELDTLHLEKNALTQLIIPQGFKSLSSLYVNENQLHTVDIDPLDVKTIARFDLKKNPLSSPPLEIVEKGQQAIASYLEQIKKVGKDYLFEAKLIIVGESGAGKTTFFGKLIDNNAPMPKDEDTTKGITVAPWVFQLRDDDIRACIKSEELSDTVISAIQQEGFRTNRWDFGGQEIYHSTHQFFLTRRSLYVLLADTREQKTDFNYWLSTVEQLGGDSPLLVVLNEKHGHVWRIDETGLRERFPFFKEKFNFDLSNTHDFIPLEKLRKAVRHYLSSLSHIGDPLPATWTAIREAIAQEPSRYISRDRYFEICKANRMTDTKKMLELSAYFHDIGVFLHYQDNSVLKNRIFLDANWTTRTVYKLLDDKTIKAQKGRFTRQEAENIWQADEHNLVIDELLSLLEQFSLVYQINKTPQYIAPEHLPEGKPYEKWKYTDNLLLFSYTFDKFMPRGLMSKIIVDLHTFIPDHTQVWLRGVVIKKGNAYAEIVETYGANNRFDIRIAGMDKKELLITIMDSFDKILSKYPKLNYDKHVPCNCTICSTTSEFSQKHFYLYYDLKDRLAKSKADVECPKNGYSPISIQPLLDDIGVWKMMMDKAVKEHDLGKQGDTYNFHDKATFIQKQNGDTIMEQNTPNTPKNDPIAIYSYLSAAIVLGGILLIALNALPTLKALLFIVGLILLLTLVAFFQLKNDNQIKEETFVDVLTQILKKMPPLSWFGKKDE